MQGDQAAWSHPINVLVLANMLVCTSGGPRAIGEIVLSARKGTNLTVCYISLHETT